MSTRQKLLFILVGCIFISSFSITSGLAKKVTMSYGFWGEEQAVGVKAQVAHFEKAHPNIHIKLQQVPYDQYWIKVPALIAGESCWDVFWMSLMYIREYAKREAVLDLTPLIERDNIDLGAYFPSALKLVEIEGKYYEIPRDISPKAITYNKNLFDEIGLDYPPHEVGENWTWTDFIIDAEKLTKKDESGRTVVYGFTSDGSQFDEEMGFSPFAYSAGWNIKLYDEETGKVNIDTPGMKLMLRLARDLVRLGICPKKGEISSAFIAGKSAINAEGSWMLGYNAKAIKDFRWGAAPYPTLLRSGANTLSSLGDAIYAKTKHPEEAWEFVKWLASKEGAETIAGTGAIIPAYREATHAWAEFFPKEFREDIQVYIDAATYAPSSAPFSGWSRVRNRLVDYYLTEIAEGRLPIEEGLKKAQEEAIEIIKEAAE